MTRLKLSLFLLAAWACLPTSFAEAIPEDRCNQLGANCVCSEPMNTNSYTQMNTGGSGGGKNPNDSTTKECTNGAVAFLGTGFIVDTDWLGCSFPTNAASDPAAFAALPSGHGMLWFLRGVDQHVCVWFTGHTFGSQYVRRAAIRFYAYHTPNFAFVDDADPLRGCNGKLVQMDNQLLEENAYGDTHLYNFLESIPAQDCCFAPSNNVGGTLPDTDRAYWRGNWVRVEVIFTGRDSNATGGNPPWTMEMYVKNVTQNTPEKLVIKTQTPGIQLTFNANRRWPTRMDSIVANFFRATNEGSLDSSGNVIPPGQCAGWRGLAFYMAAGWDTDAGQRIGAATEIESGGGPPGDTTPPAAPTNLQVS